MSTIQLVVHALGQCELAPELKRTSIGRSRIDFLVTVDGAQDFVRPMRMTV
jgi:hypothetical protein